MFRAIKVQTTSAISTASGKAPPANGMAAPRLNATAEAGAMVVIDWNSTPGRPIAFRRNVVCSGEAEDSDSVAIQLLLPLIEDRNGKAGKSRVTAACVQNRKDECLDGVCIRNAYKLLHLQGIYAYVFQSMETHV